MSMTADALQRALIEHGADEAGIRDRFGGNAQLYELCFKEFLDGAYVPALAAAMAAGDYDEAFEAAHAIKGLSGNLGLTAYYESVCALVEALREKRYEHVGGLYAETGRQFDLLRRLYAGERVPPRESPPAPRGKGGARQRTEWFVPTAIGVALITILLMVFLFRGIVANYQRNVTTESAGHLVEINYQLGEYIADQVESDWLVAYTIQSYISHHGHTGNDGEIRSVMEELRALWKVSDVMLYMEDGSSISVDGRVEANHLASEMTAEAAMRGELLSIVESDITYTVPIETELTFGGARISAISVVKSMKLFLDEMGLSSFDQSAFAYLCNDSGTVISRLNTDAAAATFNVRSLLREGTLTTTDRSPIGVDAALAVKQPTTYVFDDHYFVFSPIETRTQTFWLAYFVPERIVNKSMSAFSDSVTVVSAIVIAVFAALALLALIYINSLRKKQLGQALLTREHMFDLLVTGSLTSFALFELDKASPSFISSNSRAIIGGEDHTLHKTPSGFALRSGVTPELPAFVQINKTLGEWDGTGVFRSEFIKNQEATPPTYFELQLMPAAGDAGEYIGVAQDVTLLFERETVIRNALAMAEQANEAKTRFLSNMSHDIRTPMNAIVNMTDFAIEHMADPEKLTEDLKTIRESSEHLLGLINDILDMSRIESGRATIDNAPFDLAAELRRLQSIVAPLCAEKKLTLITDFGGVRTPVVLGDHVKVSQILMNLLSNAVKFTPKNGAIRFSAKETPSLRENYVDVRFIVEDTGMGISPAFLPRIFEPFSREDVRRVHGIQGTGLGLSICHSYVTAMGGQIRCQSGEGDGSTFTVDLFFEKAEAAEPEQPAAEVTAWDVTPFIGMRCLFCEDNKINQRIGRTILERLGFRVDLASDGREALAAFCASPARYYDVIYLDIQMPVMDGYEAAAAIRDSAHPQARTIPIIAVSANVFIEDVEKAHIAGMNGHVGKPVTTASLANETKKVFQKSRRDTG